MKDDNNHSRDLEKQECRRILNEISLELLDSLDRKILVLKPGDLVKELCD